MKTAKQIIQEQLRTSTDCPVDVFKHKFIRQELERFAQYCIDKNQGNVVDALQSDALLKELYKRLSEIHSKAFPIVVQVSPTEFKASYSNEVNELLGKVRQEINFRQEQILSFYNR